MPEPTTHSAPAWWICTRPKREGGRRVLGPFVTRELALDVRVYVEKAHNPATFWVLPEGDPDEPGR